MGFSDQHTSEINSGGTQTPALPRSHLFGSNPDLSRNVAMIVKIEEVEANNRPQPEEDHFGHYWRGFTYDIYNGQGWTTSHVESTSYNAGDHALQEINSTQQITSEVDYFQQEYFLLLIKNFRFPGGHLMIYLEP